MPHLGRGGFTRACVYVCVVVCTHILVQMCLCVSVCVLCLVHVYVCAGVCLVHVCMWYVVCVYLWV